MGCLDEKKQDGGRFLRDSAWYFLPFRGRRKYVGGGKKGPRGRVTIKRRRGRLLKKKQKGEDAGASVNGGHLHRENTQKFWKEGGAR